MIFNLFKCKHAAADLTLRKEATVEPRDEDFLKVTIHLHCLNCGEKIDIVTARMIGGVQAFLARKGPL